MLEYNIKNACVRQEESMEEQRRNGNENQEKNTFFRTIFMNNCRDKISTAGIGAGLQKQGITAAEDDACYQRAQNGAGTAFCIVNKFGQIYIIQQNGSQRKCADIHHASNCQRFTDQQVNRQCQRNIDNQA